MAFDPSTPESVLFGGGTLTEGLGDTWVVDACGTAPKVGKSPPKRDPVHKKRHRKRPCEFTEIHPDVSPSARDGAAMAYAPGDRVVMLFGGFHDAPLADTWWFNGRKENWTEVHTDDAPSPRYGAELFFVGKTLYLFGGSNGAQFFDDTWKLVEDPADTYNWVQVDTSTSPPPRAFAGAASDTSAKRALLFGGQDATGPLGDTWCFEKGNWTQEAVTGGPPARSGMVLAYDPAIRASVLFGGVGASGLLGDTWTFGSDTETWTQLDPANPPPPTAFAAGSYLANLFDTRVLIVGGIVGIAPVNTVRAFR
jgi:N-acetylneuraminic acid mutarotase